MLSWLDVRDEIVRSTRERLGQDAPVPKITSLDEKHGDVTRLPFFLNRAYMPSEKPAVTTEELYWRNLPDDAPLTVLHDFLAKFPDGIFAPLARALADRRIGRASDAELQEFLRYHPKTKFKKQIAARRKTLRLDRIQNGADVEALEHILAEDPEGEFINEVKQRIDVLARERAEAEAWACVETSSNPGELKQFLTLHPDGRFSQLARTRLDQLRATSGLEPPQPPGPPGAVGAIASSFAENWRRYAAVAALLLLGGVAAALIGGRKPLEHEARDGLARSEETERARLAGVTIEQQKALDAAGTSLEPLRIFVQQCNATACTVAQQARDRLAKAEEAERSRLAQMAAADRAALDAAGTNLGQLRTFVQQCTSSSCTVAPQARDRLAKAEEAERARLAQMAADRKALDAAGADIAQLRKFVQQCNANSCTVAPEARDRLAKAEEVDRARLAQIAADRKALDAAGTNLGQFAHSFSNAPRIPAPYCWKPAIVLRRRMRRNGLGWRRSPRTARRWMRQARTSDSCAHSFSNAPRIPAPYCWKPAIVLRRRMRRNGLGWRRSPRIARRWMRQAPTSPNCANSSSNAPRIPVR